LLMASNPYQVCFPLTYIPTGNVINIDWIEDLVENDRGPFDDLIAPSVKENREKDKSMNKK